MDSEHLTSVQQLARNEFRSEMQSATSGIIRWCTVGGFALIAFLVTKILTEHSPGSTTGWFIFNLSFLVNFPHFLASYQLLYGDFRHKWRSNHRFLMATTVAPIALAAALIYGFSSGDQRAFSGLAQLMFFTVGWHYIKQTFGVFMVCNSRDGIRYNDKERLAVKSFLFSLWAISWFSVNTYQGMNNFEGVQYPSANLWPEMLTASYVVTSILATICGYFAWRKYVRDGRVSSISGATAVAIMVIWYIPALNNPVYFLLIPFFHSMQYLYFVGLLKFGQSRARYRDTKTAEQRAGHFRTVYGFALLAGVTGGVVMFLLPSTLDGMAQFKFGPQGMNTYMFTIVGFINIHHYFIDHAIWRHDNEDVKQHVFKAPAKVVHVEASREVSTAA